MFWFSTSFRQRVVEDPLHRDTAAPIPPADPAAIFSDVRAENTVTAHVLQEGRKGLRCKGHSESWTTGGGGDTVSEPRGVRGRADELPPNAFQTHFFKKHRNIRWQVQMRFLILSRHNALWLLNSELSTKNKFYDELSRWFHSDSFNRNLNKRHKKWTNTASLLNIVRNIFVV